MFQQMPLPILEFDPSPSAIINPSSCASPQDIPDCCVLAFARHTIRDWVEQGRLIDTGIRSKVAKAALYRHTSNGLDVCVMTGIMGAPCAAAQVEELITMGVKRFVICGSAGILHADLPPGHPVLPYAAIRDEGVSYHYQPAAREAVMSPEVLRRMEAFFEQREIPYTKGKTWTTDAFYRETEAKTALRASEGCITVEMEAASLYAVAAFRGVALGYILYGLDNLSGSEWNDGRHLDRKAIENRMLEWAIGACAEL